ncbi:hypothetical protein CRM22_006725 [Opisthorchis felineus]|uniref:Uncharacterized protein n=1 Tax=Opisthorchis felineus TaxID=147828 RepID=A0A4S2LSF9_OPIFE|nr:hypothetical protein CRM22_006725 [Opisthorchis felineus]
MQKPDDTLLKKVNKSIYHRYHWEKSNPVLLARRIGTDNWVLLKARSCEAEWDKSNEALRTHDVAAQLQQMGLKDSHAVIRLACPDMVTNGPYTQGMTKWERLRFFDTALNRRAKTGFHYWGYEKPKPTKFGRYSMGAKHTFLGLCNAPRS